MRSIEDPYFRDYWDRSQRYCHEEEVKEPNEEPQATGILAVDEESDKCQRIDPSGFDKD